MAGRSGKILKNGPVCLGFSAALHAPSYHRPIQRDLEDAILAYKNALLEFTQEKFPQRWANTQMNLGGSLAAIGQREIGATRLEETVVALNRARQVWTRDRAPLYWAGTQINLGSALDTPLDWAATQNNLGGAFLALGRWEIGTANLEKAVVAFNNALDVYHTSGATYFIDLTEANLARATAIINYRQGK